MKVIIAGSRGITDYSLLKTVLKESPIIPTEVVSGLARGVDLLGKRWAEDNELPCTEFPANWDLHGKTAGFMRNREMAEYADALIAIWDGESRGTRHMISEMNKLSKPTFIYEVKNNRE